MQTKKDVLNMLENKRGRFVSGQELASELNISRSAIWKAIKNLEEDGHKIYAVTNKGYKLDERSDVLSEEGIRAVLPNKYKLCPLVIFESTDSTNTQAKKLALEKATHGTLVLAEEQTAGRGRAGKNFFSPKDTGLYMSLILKPDRGISDPQMITVAAAVAVCKAIEKQTNLKPKIKWVNDIYLDGKKICGILTEAVTDFESGGIENIVVGAGINCSTTESMLPEELRGIVGSLGVEGLSRNRLAADITGGILDCFYKLDDHNIIEEYREHSMMYGREISFMRDNEKVLADVTEINDAGNLVVRLKSGENLVLNSGEVSLGHLGENK